MSASQQAFRACAAALAVALTAGCTVGPDYDGPEAPQAATETWREADAGFADSAGEVPAAWWRVLEDERLTALIEEAKAENHDLEEARLRVRRARALRGVAASRFLPAFGASGRVQYEEDSTNAPTPSVQVPRTEGDRDFYRASFDAAWEIDLFGGNRRALEAAEARVDATIESRRAVMLAVLAEVGRNYVELRGRQRQIEAVRRDMALQAETVDLIEQRLEAGAASNFDLERARAQYRSTRARLPALRGEARAAAYRLGVLVGTSPADRADALLKQEALPLPPDVVPVGLPSEIMRRRPDIRAAERGLAQATAEVGVNVAELYPSFQIVGTSGFQALSLGDLLQASSGFGAIAGVIDWPIFQGGAIRARIDAAEVDADIAAVRYEETLAAMGEVEETLARYAESLNTRAELAETVERSRRAAELARRRYDEGAISFVAVLDAEGELAEARRRLAEADTRSLTRLVALYKALGGGWDPDEAEPTRQTPA